MNWMQKAPSAWWKSKRKLHADKFPIWTLNDFKLSKSEYVFRCMLHFRFHDAYFLLLQFSILSSLLYEYLNHLAWNLLKFHPSSLNIWAPVFLYFLVLCMTLEVVFKHSSSPAFSKLCENVFCLKPVKTCNKRKKEGIVVIK